MLSDSEDEAPSQAPPSDQEDDPLETVETSTIIQRGNKRILLTVIDDELGSPSKIRKDVIAKIDNVLKLNKRKRRRIVSEVADGQDMFNILRDTLKRCLLDMKHIPEYLRMHVPKLQANLSYENQLATMETLENSCAETKRDTDQLLCLNLALLNRASEEPSDRAFLKKVNERCATTQKVHLNAGQLAAGLMLLEINRWYYELENIVAIQSNYVQTTLKKAWLDYKVLPDSLKTKLEESLKDEIQQSKQRIARTGLQVMQAEEAYKNALT